MESKNLSKSFGVRVPLELYMQMLKVSTENKLTITDLCLYSIMNSGIPTGELNFKKGGEVDTEEINNLNLKISRMLISLRRLEEENNTLLQENKKKKIEIDSWKEIYKERNDEFKQYKLDYPKK